jgi:hypothetical protein
MSAIQINQLVEWEGVRGQKRLERLLWVEPGGGRLVFIPAVGKQAWPFVRTLGEVEGAFEQGLAKVVQLAACSDEAKRHLEIRTEDHLTDPQRKLRDQAWAKIQVLVLDPKRRVFGSRRGGRLIRWWAQRKKLDRKTLYKYLRRYWQRGQTANALQPALHLCGGPGRRHKRGDVKNGADKLGRPRELTASKGKNITKQDEEHFRAAIEDYYLNAKLPKMPAFTTTYRYLLWDHYSKPRLDGSGADFCEILPPDEVPTFAQFRYFLEKNYTRVEILKRRNGDLTFARKFRPVVNAQARQAWGPGAIYQIDSTVLDVNVVHSLYPTIVVGRPKLYWVIDVFSTMIVGFYVGFETTSYNTAGLALWTAFRDKVEVCAEYGVKISPAHWPAWGLPEMLLADRGELLSLNAGNLVTDLGINVTNTPPYRGDLKGLVERYFQKANERLIHYLPGAVDQSGDPSKPDTRKQATLAVRGLTQGLLALIWDFNHSLRKDYPLTADMVADGIEPRPVNIWGWGMRRLKGIPKEMSPATVRIALLPSTMATVTRQGLELEKLVYSCPSGLADRFVVAGESGREKVKVHYNPYLVDHVYLIGKNVEDTEDCTLTNRTDSHLGLSWEEYRRYRKQKSENEAAAELGEIERQNNADAVVAKALAEAQAKQNGLPVNLKLVKEGQEDEMKLRRMQANQQLAALLGIRETPVEQPAGIEVSKHEKRVLALLEELNAKQ